MKNSNDVLKEKKGLVAYILMVVMIILLMVVPSFTVNAEETNIISETISTNATIEKTVSLNSGKNVFRFYFTMDKNGYLDIELKDLSKTDHSNYSYSLYDNAGNIHGVVSNKVKYGYKRGAKLYCEVKTYNYNGEVKKGFFSIRVNTVKAPTYELEKNNSFTNATVLASDENSMNGSIYKKGDVDYYKYVVKKTGYMTFSVKAQDNIHIRAELYNNVSIMTRTGE